MPTSHEEEDNNAHEEAPSTTSAEPKHLQVTHEETVNVQTRITTVEETIMQHDRRLSIVEYAQTDLKTIVSQLAGLQTEQSKQMTFNEATIQAIKERTDQFADHMEKSTDRLAEKQEQSEVRIGQLESRIERQDTKWTVLQALAVAALGVALTMLAQHVSAILH